MDLCELPNPHKNCHWDVRSVRGNSLWFIAEQTDFTFSSHVCMFLYFSFPLSQKKKKTNLGVPFEFWSKIWIMMFYINVARLLYCCKISILNMQTHCLTPKLHDLRTKCKEKDREDTVSLERKELKRISVGSIRQALTTDMFLCP